MTTVVYDNTWHGLLSAIFDTFAYKWSNVQIVAANALQPVLFGEYFAVHTDTAKAQRVYKKINSLLGNEGTEVVYHTWLSEDPMATQAIYEVVVKCILAGASYLKNASDKDALFIQQTNKKVCRERHRMEAFVRFQKARDGLYFAFIEPDYNVLPIIVPHFQNRYADQLWLIYDLKRSYGVHYDLQKVQEVQMTHTHLSTKSLTAHVYDPEELLYRKLWKKYFHATGIAARENPKLHLQHMPRRYWKHLPEKLD